FKTDEKYNYEDITNLPLTYGFEISINDLKEICTRLGEQRKLVWKEDSSSIQVKILFAGHSYVLKEIHPLTINQQRVPFENFSLRLKDIGLVSDFEFADIDNQEGVRINYTPNGKFSEFYIQIIRIKFLYYSILSNPKVPPRSRIDFDSMSRAFNDWVKKVQNRSPVPSTDYRAERIAVAFVVGSYWSGDDQTKRFLDEGIWENANDDLNESLMNEISQGDTFILKSTFAKEGSSILRVKGVGKVKNRINHTVFAVNWEIKNISVDIENLGYYRKTIEQVKQDDWRLIEDRLRQYFIKNSNVRLQLDSISAKDLLGRIPFVKAMADYISRLWKEQTEESYTIHLSGEWGSGKSNVLKFLSHELEERKWFVLHYNAWEYQHIETPWWMFTNKIYKQILSKLKGKAAFKFWFKEFWWRLVIINKLSWISFLVITMVASLLIYLTKFKEIIHGELGNTLALIGSIISVGGSIWLLFKSVSGSLLPASDESAQNFQKNINDPIDTLKLHFQAMIKFPKKDIAIFVDDIDRCSSKNVVKLLEGIQTIFKSSKVLYVFAGDANWVRRCFEIEYENFVADFKKPGHSLGNFFVEKMFQMSIRIPSIDSQTLKFFLSKTLSQSDESITTLISSTDILADLKNAQSESEIEATLKKYRGTNNEQTAIEAAIELISGSETLKNIEHELEAYYELLPSNVRSVKRFINNYAIARQTLLLQRVSFSDIPMDILVRWLILKSQFPLLAEDLSNKPTILNSKELYQDILNSEEFLNLTKGYITSDKVKLIAGK
ncbi:MAG: hypothetical protein HOP37_12765, partial [Cyclobacteriaceae bacterium]|nr:hypothetical protein [Cyclobacteriaceae bacterium]